MTSFQDALDTAAGKATCEFLGAVGGPLVTMGTFSIGTGGGAGAGLLSMGLGAAAMLAKNFACDDPWDPDDPGSLSPIDRRQYVEEGSCLETELCDLLPRDNQGRQFGPGRCKKMYDFRTAPDAPNGAKLFGYTYIDCDGSVVKQENGDVNRLPLYFEVEEGGTCIGPGAPGPPPPDYKFETTLDIDNCNYNMTLLGMGKQGGDIAGPVWKIEAGGENRAGGGVIGGCNFEPVIYFGPMGPNGPGGPPQGPNGPWYGPYPGDEPDKPDGTPHWVDLVNDIIGGAIGAALNDTIQEALEKPIPGKVYSLRSVCETLPDGSPNQIEATVEIPDAKGIAAVLERVDAIATLLQPLKDFKQPICNEKPELKGDFRTISFESVERSPFGNDRLRKRFRYRSQSGIGLSGVVDHWKDFEWDAGPVCVQHSGADWGTPQVWAASVDEGKRVILHAGGEAGIDPNQVGQWRVSGSDNPRVGVSGRMKVCTKGGYYWITERLGSSARPMVATT